VLVLEIVGGLVALGLGIWLGLPGRYEQSVDEVESRMLEGRGRSRKAKRHFTPLAWIQRQLSARSSPPSDRRGFRVRHPDGR